MISRKVTIAFIVYVFCCTESFAQNMEFWGQDGTWHDQTPEKKPAVKPFDPEEARKLPELKSALFAKYFPKYKLLYKDGGPSYIVDKAGRIQRVNSSDLIIEQRIKVRDEATAIEITELKEILEWPWVVNDEELKQRAKNWKYAVTQKERSWVVERTYHGEPCCYMTPPVWEVETDAKGVVLSIINISERDIWKGI